MSALTDLEAIRDKAVAELKEKSLELRALIDDEERLIKSNRLARQEVEKAKVKIGARSTAASECLSRLDAQVPREIDTDISERSAKLSAGEFSLREQKRELHGRRDDLKNLIAQRAAPEQVKEVRANVVSIESAVADLEDDLKELKKGLEAAQVRRREVLESFVEEAKKELEALRAPAA